MAGTHPICFELVKGDRSVSIMILHPSHLLRAFSPDAHSVKGE
ncbi:MAG: hypothetical protein OJF50_000505 [Nitrospira sp.]|nr:hypothetical protein [Nitrospira sp.]